MPIQLRAKSFALLCYLAANAGKVLGKSEIFDAVWPDVTVTEDSLTQAIRDIRVAIRDEDGTLLTTVRGRGYVLNVPSGPGAPAPHTSRTLRIAVLPFNDRALTDGTRPLIGALADDIAGGLSRFRTLTVIARGSAEAAAARTADPRTVAEQLRADYLIEGSAREADGTLFLRLSLIDGSEGALAWSDAFDCTGDRLLGIEKAVTDRLVAHLSTNIEMAVEERTSHQSTSSLTAYGHFAQGRGAIRATDVDGLRVAHDHLKRAVEADPKFAEAWATLAWAELALHDYRMSSPDVMQRALSYARRAVQLSPSESVTVSSLGYVQTLLGDYDAAERNIAHALRLNPSNVDAMMDMATLMLTRGRPEEALTWLDRTEGVNPLRYLHHTHAHRAEAFYLLGRYREAVEELSMIFPLPTRRRLWMAAALAQSGRPADAEPHLVAFADGYPEHDPVAVARHSYNYEKTEDSDHLIEGLIKAIEARGGPLSP